MATNMSPQFYRLKRDSKSCNCLYDQTIQNRQKVQNYTIETIIQQRQYLVNRKLNSPTTTEESKKIYSAIKDDNKQFLLQKGKVPINLTMADTIQIVKSSKTNQGYAYNNSNNTVLKHTISQQMQASPSMATLQQGSRQNIELLKKPSNQLISPVKQKNLDEFPIMIPTEGDDISTGAKTQIQFNSNNTFQSNNARAQTASKHENNNIIDVVQGKTLQKDKFQKYKTLINGYYNPNSFQVVDKSAVNYGPLNTNLNQINCTNPVTSSKQAVPNNNNNCTSLFKQNITQRKAILTLLYQENLINNKKKINNSSASKLMNSVIQINKLSAGAQSSINIASQNAKNQSLIKIFKQNYQKQECQIDEDLKKLQAMQLLDDKAKEQASQIHKGTSIYSQNSQENVYSKNNINFLKIYKRNQVYRISSSYKKKVMSIQNGEASGNKTLENTNNFQTLQANGIAHDISKKKLNPDQFKTSEMQDVQNNQQEKISDFQNLLQQKQQNYPTQSGESDCGYTNINNTQKINSGRISFISHRNNDNQGGPCNKVCTSRIHHKFFSHRSHTNEFQNQDNNIAEKKQLLNLEPWSQNSESSDNSLLAYENQDRK